MMKKALCILFAALFATLAFTACDNGAETKETTTAAAAIASPQDLAGKKVAVQTATTADEYLNDLLDKGEINFEVLRYEKITQCYDELKLGRVDAILVDEVVAANYTDVSKIVWKNTEGEPMGICLQKGNDDLTAIVEAMVDTCYFDGTMTALANKYFPYDVTEGVRTVTEKPVLDLTKLKTITPGKLTVGMEIGYPPMEYLAEDGVTEIGFDVELAKKFAELTGLELVLKNTAWDGIFAALEKGEFDMIMSAVSITPERQGKYNLTEPYISNRLVLVVPN